jgi:predicted hotdog family 3-hydroxylacyl-ACP dehydratase
MDFYEEASLVMVPSGYKDQKVYSSVPDDGSADLTFSRASTATRVDSEGLVEKVRTNLLLQSNQFDTTWVIDDITLTSAQSGYDGSSDAWRWELTGAAGKLQNFITHSGVHTISFYAKSGTLDFVRVSVDGGNGQYFNLSTGALASQLGTIIDANIVSAGGSWYRCSFSINQAITNVAIYPATADNDLTATSGNIYIQDTQLEYGLVATPYIETTTAAVSVGPVANLPRLSYDPTNPTSPSLLLEPQRTNLVSQSEYLSGSFWFDDDITKVQNTSETLSPEGVYNAIKLTETATNARHRLASNALTITNQVYTASVFLKKGTARYGFIHLSGANAYTIVVDLEDGTITDTATNSTIVHQSVEDYGNGWYRCSVAGNMAAVTTAYIVQFGTAGSAEPTYNNYVPQFLGSTSNNLYAFGASLEAASYSTSYIPTYGAATTRGADSALKTGISSLIGQTEGTIFVEAEYIDGVNDARVSLSDGNTNNWIFIGAPEPTAGDIKMRMYINAGGVNQVNKFSSTVVTKGVHKYAMAYKENDVVMYLDGQNEGSDTSATIPACSRFDITGGSPISNNALISTGIKQVIFFPTRLTNAQLAELTTL